MITKLRTKFDKLESPIVKLLEAVEPPLRPFIAWLIRVIEIVAPTFQRMLEVPLLRWPVKWFLDIIRNGSKFVFLYGCKSWALFWISFISLLGIPDQPVAVFVLETSFLSGMVWNIVSVLLALIEISWRKKKQPSPHFVDLSVTDRNRN